MSITIYAASMLTLTGEVVRALRSATRRAVSS